MLRHLQLIGFVLLGTALPAGADPQMYQASYGGEPPATCSVTGDVHLDSDSGAYFFCTDAATESFFRIAGWTSRTFWIYDTSYAQLPTTHCLIHGAGNWYTSTPFQCDGSSYANANALETAVYFAPGVEVFAAKLACSVNGASFSAGQTLTLGVRWRKGDSLGTMTDSSGTLVLTPASITPGTVVSADIGSLCPYAANGCLMSVNIEATTLTAGAGIDVSCEVLHALF
jgi:hypothetical protein